MVESKELRDPDSLLKISGESGIHQLVFNALEFSDKTTYYVMKILELVKNDENLWRIEFGGIWPHPIFFNHSGLLFKLYQENFFRDSERFREYLEDNGLPYTRIIPKSRSGENVERNPDKYLVYDADARVACEFLSLRKGL